MKLIKSNKLVPIFLSFFILTTLVLAISQNAISIEDIVESPGTSDINIPILLENNDSVAGFQFDINFTPFLTYKGYTLTERISNETIVINNETSGLIRVAALFSENISSGNGAIMNLIFDLSENSTSGDYPINFSNLILGNIIAQPVNTTPIDAIFTIVLDSDGDGILDENDYCPLIYGCSNYSGCQYGLKEWLPPIINQEEFELQEGATLPFKFNVTDCTDDFYNDSEVKVNIFNTSLSINKTYNASGTGSDYVRINETEQIYIVNIDSNELDMPLGGYTIYTSFNNSVLKTIGFELIEKGTNGRGKGKK